MLLFGIVLTVLTSRQTWKTFFPTKSVVTVKIIDINLDHHADGEDEKTKSTLGRGGGGVFEVTSTVKCFFDALSSPAPTPINLLETRTHTDFHSALLLNLRSNV